MALRLGYDELVQDLADSFDLIPASVTLFSKHNGTQLWVHMGSQGDLDVVLAESSEWGSHVIHVEVSGIGAGRGLDAVGCLAATAATVSQLGYLWWMVTQSSVSFLRELEVWLILVLSMLVHLGSFAYLLDDETSHNHAFRQWVRPFVKRGLMLLLAPFSGDVLVFAACGLCGFNAPIRPSTREGIVRGGIWMMLLQDGMMLSVIHAVHFGAEAPQPLSALPEACLYVTLGSLTLNLPRRLAHFLVGSCEAAFREKEELADDAQISLFASQKMASRAPPMETPQSKGPSTPPKKGAAAPIVRTAGSAPPPPASKRGGAPTASKAAKPPAGKGGKSMM